MPQPRRRQLGKPFVRQRQREFRYLSLLLNGRAIFLTQFDSGVFRTVDEVIPHEAEIRNHLRSEAARAAPTFSPSSPSNASFADVAVGMSPNVACLEATDTQVVTSRISTKMSLVESDLIKVSPAAVLGESKTRAHRMTTGSEDDAVTSECLPSGASPENAINVSSRGACTGGGRRSVSRSNIAASGHEVFESIGCKSESNNTHVCAQAANPSSPFAGFGPTIDGEKLRPIATPKVPSQVSVEHSNSNKISPLAVPFVGAAFSTQEETSRLSDGVGGLTLSTLETYGNGSVQSDVEA